MMRTCLFSALVVTLAADLDAQSGAKSVRPGGVANPITITGCIEADAGRSERFTISDRKTGTTYRLSGPTVRAYLWRNVRIVGGLVPTPNIAAQAGDIDETRAAMAHQGANRPSTADMQPVEFQVKQLRALAGPCTPKAKQPPEPR
jgi:hypothetical protein